MVVRTAVVTVASLGVLILLAALSVVVLNDPLKLPLELVGTRDYTILDSDESNQNLRAAELQVAPRTCAVDQLRVMARDIKREYDSYDVVNIPFHRRFAKSPCNAVAVIGLTEKSRKRIVGIEAEPLSGSKNGDEVYFFRF
jgi:hypothetical protein